MQVPHEVLGRRRFSRFRIGSQLGPEQAQKQVAEQVRVLEKVPEEVPKQVQVLDGVATPIR